MQQRSDKVEPVNKGLGYSGGGSQKSVSLKAIGLLVLAGIVVSVLAVNVLFLGNYVSKADDVKNLQTITDAITKTKNDLTQTVTAVQNTMNALPVSVTAQVNNSITQATNTMNNQIATMQAQVNNVASKTDITNLSDEIANLDTKIDTLTEQATTDKSTITALTTRIQTLETKVATISTTNTTSGTTNTTGQVSVQVVGNVFTGSQLLNFGAMTSNSTSSQILTFRVDNEVGKTINNVQFAVGLELLDANNAIISGGLPSGTSVSLSSTGIIWTPQSSGLTYILGFVNTTPSGVFSGLGAVSQSQGIAAYQVTVTVTTGANPIANSFNIYPIIKIISFN